MYREDDHANLRRTVELAYSVAENRETSASPLLHFTTVYLFYRGKRLLDRPFFPLKQELSVAHLMLIP
jgi:hypothetical protein